jgi:hypothetical protein
MDAVGVANELEEDVLPGVAAALVKKLMAPQWWW